MTKVKTKKITCVSCGEVYSGVLYYSLYTPLSSEEEKGKMASGEINWASCPKCGTNNELNPELPDWEV